MAKLRATHAQAKALPRPEADKCSATARRLTIRASPSIRETQTIDPRLIAKAKPQTGDIPLSEA
jgi:hypothetical protein